MRDLSLILIAYLLGSIPFGYLIVRVFAGADVRATGSGGTGATNVSRRAGKAAGLITVVLDAVKGAAAIVVARWMFGLPLFRAAELATPRAQWLLAASAVAVVVGHIFPLWLGFRGGKGVATGAGVFALLAPLPLLAAGFVFGLIVWRWRYVSLGSIVSAGTIPVFIWFQSLIRPASNPAPLLLAAVIDSLLIIYAHRGNIERLSKGTESRFK